MSDYDPARALAKMRLNSVFPKTATRYFERFGPKLLESVRHTSVAELASISEQYRLYDRIEVLHSRLFVFLGRVWSDQLIIALNNIAKRNTRSYVDLLEESAAMVVQVQMKEYS